MAYLRYQVFTRDSQLVHTQVQALRRTATDEWQPLRAGVKVDSAGFVRVSLVNESQIPAYFDDLAVERVAPSPYQENHYDPFGLNLVGIEQVGEPNSAYQYNGKEKQEDGGLNWTDYGARFYDAQLGRWHTSDPLTNNAMDLTPYRYCFNNPVRFVDPTGLWEVVNGGYTTTNGKEIERFHTYMEAEHALMHQPNVDEAQNFVKGEMTGEWGRLSDGSILTSGVDMDITPKGWIPNMLSVWDMWKGVQKTVNPDNPDVVFKDGSGYGLAPKSPLIDWASASLNGLGMSADLQEGISKVAAGAAGTKSYSSAKWAYGIGEKVGAAGKVFGGLSAAISVSKLAYGLSNGGLTRGAVFNSTVDIALIFAGPLGGLASGMLEVIGVKDTIANFLDDRQNYERFLQQVVHPVTPNGNN